MPADGHKQHHHHEQKKQSKLVPRRRNTEIENEAAMNKRRSELIRERKILIAMTVLCAVATAVSFVISLLQCNTGILNLNLISNLAAVDCCVVYRFLDRRGSSPEKRH